MNIRNKLILMLAIPISALVLIAAVGFRSQSSEAERNEDATEIASSLVQLEQLAFDVSAERFESGRVDLIPNDQGSLDAYNQAVETTDSEIARLQQAGDAYVAPVATRMGQMLEAARGSDTSHNQYGAALDILDESIDGLSLANFDADSVLAVQAIQDGREVLEVQEATWIDYFTAVATDNAEPVALGVQQVAGFTNDFAHVDTVAREAEGVTLSTGAQPMIGATNSESARQLATLSALASEDLFQNTNDDLSLSQVAPSLAENRAEWDAAFTGTQDFLLNSLAADATNINNSRSLFTLFAVLGTLLLFTLVYVIGRSILGPLGRLMDHADLMTTERLPFAVAKLRSLGSSDEIPEIRAIPKEADDEIGSLVDAFNDVQETAVKVATDQARSRRNVAEMFVSLGRRNQQLNHRMINLITDLERDEQDPNTLAGLYQLDHLATRMRRNAESLLVLAGNRSPRQWSRPVPIEDVLRSSLSEVELFERIEVGDVPEVAMQGNVVADVTHLLAELLDNATQFSEPSTTVSISAQETLEGVEIEIFDEGFGVNEQDLIELNERISNPPALDEAPSRLLGLFVVGRLSQQHGIDVELQSQPGVGTVATIFVPSSLFAQEVDDPRRIEAPTALAGEPTEPSELLAELDSLAVDPAEQASVFDTTAADVPGIEAPAALAENTNEQADMRAELEALAHPDEDTLAPGWGQSALHEEDLADASVATMEEVEEALPAFPDVTIDQPADPHVVTGDTWPLTKLNDQAAAGERTTSISELDAMSEAHAAAAPAAPVADELENLPTRPAHAAEAPVAQAPVAETPSAPAHAAPTMEAPIVEPAAQAPVAQAPVEQAPVAQAPVQQAPVAPASELPPIEPFSIAPPLPGADPAPANTPNLPDPPILESAPEPELPRAAQAPAAPEGNSANFGGLPTRAPLATLESDQVTPELIPLETPAPAAPEESPAKSASAFAAFATGVHRGLSKVNEEPNEGENA